MTTIHPNCRAELQTKIRASLDLAEVTHGTWLDWASVKSLSDVSDTLPRQVRESLVEIVGEDPIFDIVYSRLREELAAKSKFSADKNATLLSALPDINLDDLTESSLKEIESIPKEYFLLLKLPLRTDCGLDSETSVTPFFSLLHCDAKFKIRYETQEISGSFDLYKAFNAPVGDRAFPDGNFFLILRVNGYLSPHLTTSTAEEGVSEMKAFLGAGFALEFFSSKNVVSFGNSETPVHYFQEQGERFCQIGNTKFDVFESEKIEQISLAKSIADFRSSEEPSIWSPPPEQGFAYWKQNQLRLIGSVFDLSTEHVRLKRACQWYFESLCGSNKLLAFLQATTVIEILLGEGKQVERLTELLKNRCAYVIAQSRKDRDYIANLFERIYDTRSRIVHQGKNRLTNQELGQFRALQTLCRRIIRKELQMLQADVPLEKG